MRALALLLTVLFVLPAAAQEPPHRLTVTGEGQVAQPPDMAVLTLGVTTEAKEPARAMDAASAATAGILDTLAAAGLADTDVQTGELTLSPIRSSASTTEGERITGFRATNIVTAKLRDLDRLGAVLGAVLDAGANTFRGLRFDLQDPAPARDEARRRAVADAMHKAELFADAAGLTLGPVLEFNESPGSGRPEMMRAAAAAPVPVAEGEVTISAEVTMVFQITGP
ncbi:SIMPL domain-containing protein [Psychromarinibacter sp. C21-152]|uniref:SIMPL domain-containing protein n=1 Tax=Psychromarinibacter sediminicola TaxID=3033385 RepID=A0AAE3NM45_9RHOB|nr:SIMPL domain-containing protein [Psychromarinibacter sediminicola]MDF0600393.1 SIMPL domain-containing protein [Psychromarinibacter sediminicola]